MRKIIWRNPDAAILLLRIAFGLMMMVHGWQKIQNFEQMSSSFADPFGIGPQPSLILAISAEFFCSILVLLGFLTPLALVPLMVTMLVAIFHAHGDDPWQKKELAVAYLSVYATLMVAGPGKYSLDHKLFNKSA
jgi:putative oxidoreductase